MNRPAVNTKNIMLAVEIVIAVIVAAVAALGGRWIYQKFFKDNKDIDGTQEHADAEHTEAIKNELKEKLKKPGMKLSYSDSTYMEMADELFSEFGPVIKGKFENIWPIISKLKTTPDFLALNKAYGVRKFGTNYNTAKNLSTSFADCSDFKSQSYWRAFATAFGGVNNKR